MIWLICFSALISLYSMFNVYQVDSNNYMRSSTKLKYICENTSFNGAQYLNPERYAQGLLIFDYDESLKAIHYGIKSALNVYDDLTPRPESSLKDSVKYKVIFIDESLIGKVYSNGILESQFSFSFPYKYVDTDNGYSREVYQPTVFVKINLGNLPMRVGTVKYLSLDRTASYELTERTR